MSRKILLVLIAITILLVGVWFYFSFKSTSSPSGTTSSTTLGSLFPFGPSKTAPSGTTGDTTQTGTTTGDTTQTIPPETTSALTHLSSKRIAGFTVVTPTSSAPATVDINDPTGKQVPAQAALPFARFAEQGTGYIYDVKVDGTGLVKQSGTVIAQTAEALFANSGNSVVLRYVKSDNQTVASYLGQLVPAVDATSTGTLRGDFLPDNVSEIIPSPDLKNFFFLNPTATGVAGITMKSDGTSKKQIFSSPFTEWLLDWSNTGLFVTTKPSGTVLGQSYSVTTNGVLSKVLGDINGLTTKVSPDGSYVLYSVSKNNSVVLYIDHLKDGTQFNTGLSTLPEKCVWNGASTAIYCGATTSADQATYPDDWYQGKIHFNDSIWKINPATGRTAVLNSGEGNALDITKTQLDSKESVLVFTNKNDGSLWSFKLTQ